MELYPLGAITEAMPDHMLSGYQSPERQSPLESGHSLLPLLPRPPSRLMLGLALVLCGLVMVGSASAATGQETVITPEQIPGIIRVEAEDLLSLVEQEKKLVIIDSRIRMDRRQGYIEGSLSLPDNETSCAALERVLSNRERPVLFYCNGVHCGRSGVAAGIALKCGYTRLYWYRNGFEDWKQKGYPFLKQ